MIDIKVIFDLIVLITFIVAIIYLLSLAKEQHIGHKALDDCLVEEDGVSAALSSYNLVMLQRITSVLNFHAKSDDIIILDIQIPYELSNKITMLNDKEELEYFDKLERFLKGKEFFKKIYDENYKTELLEYKVTNVWPKNKMKGPYVILNVKLKKK